MTGYKLLYGVIAAAFLSAVTDCGNVRPKRNSQTLSLGGEGGGGGTTRSLGASGPIPLTKTTIYPYSTTFDGNGSGKDYGGQPSQFALQNQRWLSERYGPIGQGGTDSSQFTKRESEHEEVQGQHEIRLPIHFEPFHQPRSFNKALPAVPDTHGTGIGLRFNDGSAQTVDGVLDFPILFDKQKAWLPWHLEGDTVWGTDDTVLNYGHAVKGLNPLKLPFNKIFPCLLGLPCYGTEVLGAASGEAAGLHGPEEIEELFGSVATIFGAGNILTQPDPAATRHGGGAVPKGGGVPAKPSKVKAPGTATGVVEVPAVSGGDHGGHRGRRNDEEIGEVELLDIFKESGEVGDVKSGPKGEPEPKAEAEPQPNSGVPSTSHFKPDHRVKVVRTEAQALGSEPTAASPTNEEKELMDRLTRLASKLSQAERDQLLGKAKHTSAKMEPYMTARRTQKRAKKGKQFISERLSALQRRRRPKDSTDDKTVGVRATSQASDKEDIQNRLLLQQLQQQQQLMWMQLQYQQQQLLEQQKKEQQQLQQQQADNKLQAIHQLLDNKEKTKQKKSSNINETKNKNEKKTDTSKQRLKELLNVDALIARAKKNKKNKATKVQKSLENSEETPDYAALAEKARLKAREKMLASFGRRPPKATSKRRRGPESREVRADFESSAEDADESTTVDDGAERHRLKIRDQMLASFGVGRKTAPSGRGRGRRIENREGREELSDSAEDAHEVAGSGAEAHRLKIRDQMLASFGIGGRKSPSSRLTKPALNKKKNNGPEDASQSSEPDADDIASGVAANLAKVRKQMRASLGIQPSPKQTSTRVSTPSRSSPTRQLPDTDSAKRHRANLRNRLRQNLGIGGGANGRAGGVRRRSPQMMSQQDWRGREMTQLNTLLNTQGGVFRLN